MTTDLTGDFELGEDEFDWDVFAPDPDATEIAAEAAALRDEDELNLDDSDFDWEAALRDDPEVDDGGQGATRSGAAYDRIVQTVRRSFEEPDLDAPADKDHAAMPSTEAAVASTFGPEQTESGTALPDAPSFETETDLDAEADREEWLSPDEKPAVFAAFAAFAAAERQPEVVFVTEEPVETGLAAAFAPEPEREPETQPAPAPEPAEARLAAMAATVAAVETEREAAGATPTELETEPVLVADVSAQWDEGAEAALGDSSLVDAPTRKSHGHHTAEKEKEGRSWVLTATYMLASLILVIIAVVVVVYAMHHRTPATTTAPPPHTAPAVSPSAATARIQSATDAIDSATTSASVGLSSLVTFPTPANVEKIINPYISSLQLYGTLLSGSNVPAQARSEASSAAAQVRQDLTFLDTIDALPPVQLGAFLKQFDADATQLQTTLNSLEQNLRTQAP